MRPRSSCSFIANPMVLAFPLDTLATLQDVCNSHSGQAGKPLPAMSEWLTRAAGFIPPSAAVLAHDTCHPAIRRAVLRKFDILGRCVGASDNTLPPPAPTSRHIADPPGQRPPRTPFVRSVTPPAPAHN